MSEEVILQHEELYLVWTTMFKEGSIPFLAFIVLYFVSGCWHSHTYTNLLILAVIILLPLVYSYVAMFILIEGNDALSSYY